MATVACCASVLVFTGPVAASGRLSPRSSGPYVQIALAVGGQHGCGILTGATGKVKCWGSDRYGELGCGCRTGVGAIQPRPVSVVKGPIGDAPFAGAAVIAAGGSDSCVITKTSHGRTKTYCWGQNNYGQLGNGTTRSSNRPVLITGPAGFVDLAGSTIKVTGNHTCEAMVGGSIWCWGLNNLGQLGDGTDRNSSIPVEAKSGGGGHAVGPFAFSDNGNTAKLSAAVNDTCVLQTSGTVWCWGANSYGQLGDGARTRGADLPVEVELGKFSASELTGVTVVVAGDHSCAVVAHGPMWCWGRNNVGQLGDGTTTSSSVPVEAGSDPPGGGGHAVRPHQFTVGGNSSVATAAMGDTCVVQTSGTMWCWGANSHGQLGNGTTKSARSPSEVTAGKVGSIASVTSGLNNTCALSTTGFAWCWGENNDGQFGNGSTASSSAPVSAGAPTTDASNFGPDAISSDGKDVWVANYGNNTVTVVNALTGSLAEVISSPLFGFNGPDAISSDGTHVWVANYGDNSVTEIDASTGALVQVIAGASFGFAGPDAISSDGTDVWVANSTGNSVTELDASTGELVQVLAGHDGFEDPDAISSDGTAVWVANSAGNSVAELSAATGGLVQSFQSKAFDVPDAISSDGTHVWVANYGNDTVTELDASTQTVTQVIKGAKDGLDAPVAISSDGTHVWVASEDGNTVTELVASTGALHGLLKGSGFNAPDAISSDGQSVWVANYDGNTVTEIGVLKGESVRVIKE